jgi:hypothetical protein
MAQLQWLVLVYVYVVTTSYLGSAVLTTVLNTITCTCPDRMMEGIVTVFSSSCETLRTLSSPRCAAGAHSVPYTTPISYGTTEHS